MLSHCFTQTGFLSSLWLHPHCCTQREVAPSDPGFSSEKLLSTRIDSGMRVRFPIRFMCNLVQRCL